jgi:hypothetical protein
MITAKQQALLQLIHESHMIKVMGDTRCLVIESHVFDSHQLRTIADELDRLNG